MTLGEAIQKLRALEHEDDMANQISTEIKAALELYDVVHALFNCGTSIQDEIAAHIWMLFATKAKISEMHRAVASLEHRHAEADLGRIGKDNIATPASILLSYLHNLVLSENIGSHQAIDTEDAISDAIAN
ncbi:MAG: hypothetical protein KME60_08675 [Cyanomargarita calcarea GSE-NOS-MK-12-04C]|jgi:hypothetical protein|uniref:Uncharacterized protein n=1 Tax=Cyanomargarita calcarea GSE-NOS-MK-12-04C TaxID=2839659 RepID=A0A951QJA8_9CYAN|nr:hypothetical protein [Cyanomargarita calcarea GSE-NOS-MK-12-04C]